jgi:hypothetical protein
MPKHRPPPSSDFLVAIRIAPLLVAFLGGAMLLTYLAERVRTPTHSERREMYAASHRLAAKPPLPVKMRKHLN